MIAPLASPTVCVDTARATLTEVRSRARLHWRTCWAQRFTGQFCQACWDWDQEEIQAERALKRAEREARR